MFTFQLKILEDAVLELHGIKEPERGKDIVKLVNCPRCKTKNPMGNVRCSFCGMVIDKDVALRMEEGEREKNAELQVKNEELQKRLEKLENVISSLLTSQGKEEVR